MIEWPLRHLLGEGLSDLPAFVRLGLPAELPWVMIWLGLPRCWAGGYEGLDLASRAGRRLHLVYLALFGKWKLSMLTLSAVLVAAPVAGVLGLFLGILAVKWRPFERLLVPILNVMQSHAALLLSDPGCGVHSASVPIGPGPSPQSSSPCRRWRGLRPWACAVCPTRSSRPGSWPAARGGRCCGRWRSRRPATSLMVGVNQVIMQCLAMVVIASFVGAKGLGQDLLFRLQGLRIGQALEIGVAIVFIAVMLDRLSFALTEKQPEHRPEGPFWKVHPFLTAAGAVILVSIIAALITPYAQSLPKSLTITTAPMWDALVDFITLHFFDPLAILRDSLLLYVLIPLRSGFQWVPWVAVAALVASIGWRLAGWRLALISVSFIAFIAFSGYWARASITAYMVFFALLVCLAFGLPLGIWASKTLGRTKAVTFLCDFFQTFPSFIYLIPVIMLFQVGDVAAITAIVIYASIPVVRYTIIGLRSVPSQTIEAAITSGCTPRQVLWKVRMPLAIPEIMLGLNQTIMFALFMVIIAAFIGTKDLGQEIFRALTFSDSGKGLVVGLCVAAIGLTADRLITEWAHQRKKVLGLV